MPTPKQQRAAELTLDNIRSDTPKTTGEILREAGYSDTISTTPTAVTKSAGFLEVIEQAGLTDEALTKAHREILNTTKIEHMVFPLGPRDEDDPNLSGANPNEKNPSDDVQIPVERTTLTDGEIIEMLAEVNCKVKRIVHGQTARHVYYWSPDGKLKLDAVKLGYALKGKLTNGDTPLNSGNTYNTFIQQNNVNPNAPESRKLVDDMVNILMNETKDES